MPKAKKKVSESQMSPTSESLKKSHAEDRDNGGSQIAIMNENLGGTGTKLMSGILSEDYNEELSGSEGLEKFDQMRRTDAQASAMLLAIELPIRATRWSVKPAEDEEGEIDEQDWKVADFVEDNLFNKLSKTWDETLKEVCTMFPFGFSLFEKVYGADEQGNIILKKLAYRKQTSILRWETEENLPGVTQVLTQPIVGGPNDQKNTVSIPDSKLVIFTHQREGDNYEGISVLRPAYKHWFFKENLYRFDGIRHEKQSVGVPVIYLGDGATPEDKTAAQTIVENLRVSESTGIVIPGSKNKGWLFEFANLNAGDSTNLFESIKHHNREMVKAILAQFLELGDTESGSRSLSEDQSSLFLLCLEAAAKNIRDIFNRYVIPELVDYNFNVERYPTLQFDKIGVKDLEKFANMVSTLVGGGIINTDENIEDFVREMYGFPAREKGVTAGTVDDQNMQDGNGEEIDTPDNEGDVLDQLESELQTLQASDDFDEEEFDLLFDEVTEAMLYSLEDDSFQFAAKGSHLSEETKKKISEALKKAGGGQLVQSKKALSSRISQSSDTINAKNDEFKSKTEGLRNEIANLKSQKEAVVSGRGGTAARKQLAASIKSLNQKIASLRAERNASTYSVKKLRTQDIQTRKQVIAVIKERKSAIQETTKRVQAEIKSGRMSLDSALQPMKKQIQENTMQISEIRKEMKDLPKGDKKREAMSAMIEGLLSENTANRKSQTELRGGFNNSSKAKRQEIDTVKQKSGLYHEHGHDHEQCGCFDDEYMELSSKFNNSFIIKLQNECSDEKHFAEVKKKGFRINKFEELAPRPLTFAERKVNFESLGNSMESFSKILEEQLNTITEKQKADILAQVKKAVENNDINAISEISAKYAGELSQALTNIQKELFEIGKKTAATEMGVKVPPTAREVTGAIRVQNDAVVAGLVAKMETSAKTSATEQIMKKGGSITDTDTALAIAAASESMDKVLTSARSTLQTLGITGAVNLGRSSIFERYPEKVYAFQYSAILDDRTTEICRSLDGRIVRPGSPEFYKYSPPRHFNCRSIWVEILQDETFKPNITGIPSSIPGNATLDTFKDLKAPIILKGSPAIKIIEQELEERKTKLADLQKMDKYPNRQKQHQERINELEKALQDAEEQKFSEDVRNILRADGVKFLGDDE